MLKADLGWTTSDQPSIVLSMKDYRQVDWEQGLAQRIGLAQQIANTDTFDMPVTR